MARKKFAISFSREAGERKAYRARIEGLHVKVAGRPSVYAARDISPTGVGLDGGTGMREGQLFELNLFFKGRLTASDLKARVVRSTATFTGLVFIDLDRRQEDAVHAIVLEEQKRQAELRKNDGFNMN